MKAQECFGDFVACVYRKDAERLRTVYKTALSESSGLTGGYTVPPEYSVGMLKSIAEKTIMRQRAFVQPMKAKMMEVGLPDITTVQSAGVAATVAGLKMGWGAEASTESETEPTFKAVTLTAEELSGYAVVSNVWLQDAVGNEGWLKKLLIDACAWYEDFAYFQGTGAGQPLGALNAPCALTVTRTAGNQIQLVDVASMVAKLLPSSLMRAFWVVSQKALSQLTQMNDGTGRAMWIPNEGVSNLADRTGYALGSLMAMPVFATEKTPPLGTKGDLMLIDPGLYVIGDREEIIIDVSDQATLAIFQRNQSIFRIVRRVDGKPAYSAATTLQDGSTQVSSIVILN